MCQEVRDSIVQNDGPLKAGLKMKNQAFSPLDKAWATFRTVRTPDRDVDQPGTKKSRQVAEGSLHFCTPGDQFRFGTIGGKVHSFDNLSLMTVM